MAKSSTDLKNTVASAFSKIFKPVNQSNILYHYTPIVGLTSYTVLSVNVMNPDLIISVFPKRDITNILLVNSLVGVGLHVYNRPILTDAAPKSKVMYCAYGSLLFSFGSVLLWAVLRTIVPDNKLLTTVLGLASGFTLTAVGKECLDFVDSKVKSVK
ncbi:hypothetical protein LSTR_LSTR000689 [Laodelphax striatellus]|uniref:Uncharacterized protein n=1 Tax=Laodelphax striatellus TaxID=195883 RepID=A0A482XG78_LAOST|nr:hypothetical protein LSTR_LSTR000689 [Laodelphax striatellus]